MEQSIRLHRLLLFVFFKFCIIIPESKNNFSST